MAVPDWPALHSSVDEESLIKIRVTRLKRRGLITTKVLKQV